MRGGELTRLSKLSKPAEAAAALRQLLDAMTGDVNGAAIRCRAGSQTAAYEFRAHCYDDWQQYARVRAIQAIEATTQALIVITAAKGKRPG